MQIDWAVIYCTTIQTYKRTYLQLFMCVYETATVRHFRGFFFCQGCKVSEFNYRKLKEWYYCYHIIDVHFLNNIQLT
jgi:hypothetical protein